MSLRAFFRKLWRRVARLFKPEPPPAPYTGPPIVLFDWHRDYGPLWEPGSTAFWLEPEAKDIKPGVWPMPMVKLDPKRVPDIRLASPSLASGSTTYYANYLNSGMAAQGLLQSSSVMRFFPGEWVRTFR